MDCKGKVKLSCLRLLNNHNRIYNTSLSHKREHEFVLVSIGKKVCGSVLQCDTIAQPRSQDLFPGLGVGPTPKPGKRSWERGCVRTTTTATRSRKMAAIFQLMQFLR